MILWWSELGKLVDKFAPFWNLRNDFFTLILIDNHWSKWLLCWSYGALLLVLSRYVRCMTLQVDSRDQATLYKYGHPSGASKIQAANYPPSLSPPWHEWYRTRHLIHGHVGTLLEPCCMDWRQYAYLFFFFFFFFFFFTLLPINKCTFWCILKTFRRLSYFMHNKNASRGQWTNELMDTRTEERTDKSGQQVQHRV